MNTEENDGFGGEEENLSRIETSPNAKCGTTESMEKRNRQISAAILAKPFCKDLKKDLARAIVSSGGELTEGRRTTIDFGVNQLVISTIEAIVEGKSDEEWLHSLEVILLTLGKPEIDFSLFRECIESNCQKEIAELTHNLGNGFEPNVKQSIQDILRSFEMDEDFDFVSKAFESILEFYEEEKNLPRAIRQIRRKVYLTSEDFVTLADMCQFLDEEQLAAKLYAAGFLVEDDAAARGMSLVKLADLYMNSEWPKNGGREWDVMKAVNLLTEALSLGCVSSARDALEGMREQLFEEYEDEPDVDYFIRNYQPDALCLAAFCLGVGIGWKKDIASAQRLFEAALSQGYTRASYYLKEILSGRVK